jgi:GntR family transcriptional repressor for pyruvate dehydrogenase complex
VTRPKLSDTVAARIAAPILTGDLEPGDRLPTEAELCDQIGVSRTVIRDAMRTLSARGLVHVYHGTGMIVAAPSTLPFAKALTILLAQSDVTVGDVIDSRAVIDIGVGSLAASRGTEADLIELSGILEAFRSGLANEDWETVQQVHGDFHRALLHSVHMPVLEMLLKPMQDLVQLSSVPPRRDDPSSWELHLHVPIVEAVGNHDVEETQAALIRHYETMNGQLYNELRSMPFRNCVDLERVAFIG